MEDIIEIIAKSIFGLLSLVVRAMVWLILEMHLLVVLWYTGWPIVRLVSLSYYPKEGINESKSASHLSHFIIGTTGFVFLIALGAALSKLVQVVGNG